MKKLTVISMIFAVGLAYYLTKLTTKPVSESCTLDARVVFGYKDSRPARFVGDRYEQMLFLEKIQSPCEKQRQDCGFHFENSDAPIADDIYSKIILSSGEKSKKILLHVAHSSVSPDDLANRVDPFQKWQSEQARNTFLDGIKNADVVFYNGHSRTGGGPDFDVPLMTSSEHVNYEWYEKNQPGFTALLDSLRSAKDLKVLGLFSCSSTQHFSKSIKQTKTGLRLLTGNKPVYFSDAIQATLDSLSSVLNQAKCNAQI